MPQVPIVEQNVQTQGIGAPRLSTPPQSAGISSGLSDVAKTAAEISQQGYETGNQVALIESQRKIDDWEANNLFDPKNGAFTKKGAASFGLPEQTSAQYNQDMKAIRDGLANDDQKLAFDKMAISRWGTIQPRLQTYVRTQMDDYAKGQEDATKDSSANRALLYWNDPKTSEASIKSIGDITEASGIREGKSPEEIANAKLDATSTARVKLLAVMADKDPMKAVKYFEDNVANFSAKDYVLAQKMVGGVEQDMQAKDVVKGITGQVVTGDSGSIINYVMHTLEGGDKVVADGNGTAKFGINSKANPGVDVENLTADQAAQIYKTKYWDANNIDKLPAVMRLPVFDAAVNGFDPKVLGMTLQEAVTASSGDPRKFLEIRQEYYQKLAESDPEKYGPQLQGWINRLGNVNSQLDAAQGKMPSLIDAYAKIDATSTNPVVAEKAKNLYKQQYDLIEQSQKQTEENASRAVAEYDAKGEVPPMSLIVQMNPKQQAERQAKNYDPIEFERIRQQVSYGQPVNLEEYRWRLTPKQFQDLVQMQGDPNKQDVARSIDSELLSSSNLTAITGKSSLKTKEDYERVQRYRDVVYNSIAAQERVSGKKVTADEVTGITDRLILKGEGGGSHWYNPLSWGSGDSQYDVPNIPRAEGQYMMGGEPVAYNELIAALTIQARAHNLPVTDEVLAGLYQNAIKSGKLADKYK